MMKRIFYLTMLIACLCGVRVSAQEAASGRGWSVREAKQEVSRSIPSMMMSHDRVPVSPVPPVLEKQGERSETSTHNAVPFPVSTPVKIVYPRKAVHKGWEGQTVVAAEILPDGSVGRTALAKTSGYNVLDHAAMDAIKTWKFSEASPEEDAVPQYVDIPVMFKLQNED